MLFILPGFYLLLDQLSVFFKITKCKIRCRNHPGRKNVKLLVKLPTEQEKIQKKLYDYEMTLS